MTREFTEWDTRNFFKALKVMLDSLSPKDVAAVELGMFAVIREDMDTDSIRLVGDNVRFNPVKGGRLDRRDNSEIQRC